jgi:hypothetical protein
LENEEALHQELVARVEKLEVVAVLAQRFIHHLSRLIDPGGREWNDYLAMIDALQALKRPNVEAAEDNG